LRGTADAVPMRLASLTIAAVAAAVLAASTGAAPTPLSPAPNAETSNTHPTFRWAPVRPPEIASSITISKSPTVGPDGEFPTANLVDFDDLEFDATSWTPTRALAVGTYWWHVASVDTTPGAKGKLFTPAVKLTIRTTVAAQSIKVQWSAHQFLATLSLKANVTKVDVTMKLFAGSRLLQTQKGTANNFLVDQPTTTQAVFTVPTKVKRGTALRLVATLTVKGDPAKSTLTRTLRAR
jgi:hypothetical protein